MDNYYKIAGLTVKMDSYGKTLERANTYKISECACPDIVVVSFWEKIKHQYPQIPDDSGEYLATGSDFYKKLLDFDGMMLHSSAVVVDNNAYLFSAPSGTGKSTHTELWLKAFGDRAYILNDDKPAIRLENGIWYAYGTPWSGKYNLNVNSRVPVKGIAIIERSIKNKIEPYSGGKAIRDILGEVNKFSNYKYRIKLMELLDKLMTTVPIWKLKCNMDPSAAIMSYEAMSGEKYKENKDV